ncbi:MAG: glycosyltransferase family 4 protein [bacterium]|nr:glycosyltransferase family 4 protein [bacterium]
MNILIINWRDMKNPLYGGAEIHITKIAEHLAQENRVFFLTSGYKDCIDGEKRGVRYIHIGNELFFNFAVYKGIKRLIKEYGIDIIVEDINKVPFYSPLFTDVPVLVVIPHIFGRTIFKQAPFPAAMYVYLSEKPIKSLYRKSFFEVISKSTKDDLVKRGIDERRIMVAECGVDYENPLHVKKCEYPLLVYVGRLKKYKSIDRIILAMPEILKKYGNAKLMIVGTGDYRESLEKLAKRMNLSDKILFTGYVSEKRKFEILKSAWVSVYPSLIEGWGIVNIEANSLRTPVVCANVPGLRDSVKDGFSGLLYDYEDTRDLALKIDSVISDKDRYEKFCSDAFEWSLNFNWNRTVRLTSDFIKEKIVV